MQVLKSQTFLQNMVSFFLPSNPSLTLVANGAITKTTQSVFIVL